jgi:regulatory protein
LLEKLASEGLQSDERFAESFVHHRIGMGQGPIKIQQELRQRGVDQALIDNALTAESFDWLSLANEVRLKKFGDSIPDDYQKKAKQLRFLYSRGFNTELINQLFR